MRKKIVKLPEAEGDRVGESGSGPLFKLLIVGDSAAAGVGVSQQEQALLGKLTNQLSDRYRLAWHLEAKTGNTTDETLTQIEALPNQTFDLVVISTGVNDVTSKLPVNTWRKQLLNMHDLIEQKFKAKEVFYSA
ncbi:MAG: SGNH/GDSL hydrolase family protein, partial [Pseudomonadales bacterium]|nr:SGNH/GDSL hydrolase family protein [Pseudomonadales bacterium]